MEGKTYLSLKLVSAVHVNSSRHGFAAEMDKHKVWTLVNHGDGVVPPKLFGHCTYTTVER
jgi:hypothetical protein